MRISYKLKKFISIIEKLTHTGLGLLFVLSISLLSLPSLTKSDRYDSLINYIVDNNLTFVVKIIFVMIVFVYSLYLLIKILKIVNFINLKKQLNRHVDIDFDFKLDEKDFNFNVKNFQGIHSIQFNLPLESKWIFFTGNNGFGKTNILQAIARVLSPAGDERIYNGIKALDKNTLISLKVNNNTRVLPSPRDKLSLEKETYRVMAYGASRLSMGSESNSKKFTPCQSLFEPQVLLRNIEKEGLSRWIFRDTAKFDSCVDKLKLLIPSLKKITVDKQNEVWYHEMDNDGGSLPKVKFQDLATGYQNIISMVGDIILNLEAPRLKSEDISILKNLKAFVIIDEVELYLHPIWQKSLPSMLSNIFPNIHFIVSTHSPMPIIGAARDSVFIKVNRTKIDGITLTRLDQKIDVSELLPNSILTSPLFGMEDITTEPDDRDNKLVRVEDSYDEVITNKKIEINIKNQSRDNEKEELIRKYRESKKL